MIRRRKKGRLVRDYVVAAILLLVFVWLVSLLLGILGKEERARRAATEAQAKLTLLSERETALRTSLKELSTERGEDAALRETYGVARPGEEVIIVLQPEPTAPPPEPSWWEHFLGWFGNR